jgi:pimeloyl-ACP methyl ester carboxylesterase
MGREEVEFYSGGERCAAWLFRPEAAAAPVPCVVMASGLSCVREQRLDAFARRFAEAGLAALVFDYRHFGASGGEPRQLMRADRQRDDWRAAIAFARSREGIDPRRLALWGFSLGGGHAQAVAISEPGIAAVVCVAPVIDGVRTLLHIGGPAHLARVAGAALRDALGAALGRDPHLVPAGGPPGSGAVLASPEALAEFEATTPPGSTWRNELCARAALRPPYRLERKVGRISCPILYCIADDDEINPPALGIAAARNAPRGELRRYPGGHFAPLHGDGFEPVVADQIEFLRRAFAAA